MGQTRMFRDRVVSMEQTLEGGEKHLPLLRELCREALPEHEFREHSLDHERDLFVMDFGAPDGSRTRICWTRMVLYDAERIPTLTGDPAAALRGKIVELIRGNANRPEIVVTFRHLEEGWVDTPEPRREGRRRRRGGKSGGRGPERGGPAPARRPQQPGSARGGPVRGGPQPAPRGISAPRPSGPQPAPRGISAPRPSGPQRPPAPQGPPRPSSPAAQASPEDGAGAPGDKRRRRSRRRRRGGRGGGGGAAPGPGSAPPAGPGA